MEIIQNSCDPKIAIFGGGVGGVSTALELANAGFHVTIYEKNSAILSGSSDATPGRAGLGFHYIHVETGKLYLRATIKVVKQFPDCMLGHGEDEDHHLRHGLYFIMKTADNLDERDVKFASQHSVDAILKTYELLRDEYARLVALDPNKRVFGDPADFFVVEDPRKYEGVVDVSKVAAVVNTREELLNWPKMRQRLITMIAQNPNVTVRCDATVRSPRYDYEKRGFFFFADDELARADYVVNCTWEEAEFLSHQMGFPVEKEARTNRLKMILTVDLPPSLIQRSSMFFCMGPHAMFSNMGDGKGMITYAPETNVHYSTALRMEREAKNCLKGKPSPKALSRVDAILSGISQYIPSMSEAKVVKVGFGVIKTKGTVDVHDHESDFHRRDYLGIEERALGWIDHSCMKLLYFLENGQRVKGILESHMTAMTNADIMAEVLANSLPDRVDLKKVFRTKLFLYFSVVDLTQDYNLTREQLKKTLIEYSKVVKKIGGDL